MLHLITGRANSGKTGRAYRALEDALGQGQRCALVLPSRPDVQRARGELASIAPLGLDILTFDDLVRVLWSVEGDGRGIASTDIRSLSLSALLPPSAPRSYRRLASTCVDALCDQSGDTWRSYAPGAVGEPAEPLRALIAAYGEWLREERKIEQKEAMHVLAAGPGRYYDLLVFHRFSDFSFSQTSLIRGLSAENRVILTLTWERDLPATSALGGLVDALCPDSTEVVLEEAFNTNHQLVGLAAAIFSDPIPLQTNRAVRFVLSEGEEAQARAITKEVVSALEDGTVESGSQVAVVFRDAAAHVTALARAFRESGISADFDVKVPLGATTFGAGFVMALEAISGRHDRLLALVRSGLSSLPPGSRRALEAEWRRRGQRDALVMLRQLRSHDQALADVMLGLFEARLRPLVPTDVRALAQLANLLHQRSAGIRAAGANTASELDSAAQASVAGVIQLLDSCLHTAPRIQDVLEVLGERDIAPSSVERPGHVQVTSASRVRGRRFEVVILGGLNAGEFPAIPEETIVPGNAASEVLEAFGGQTRFRNPLFEQLLFYDIITRARRRLVLCARVADADAEPAQLSPFYETVADFFRKAEDELPPHVLEPLASLPSHLHGPERARLRGHAVANCDSTERTTAAAYRARKKTRTFLIPDWDAGEMTFSASQIEAYLGCPYRWYRDRVLGPRELERDFGARDEGDLAHRLLASVYGGLREQGVGSLGATSLPVALSLLDRSFEALTRRDVSVGEQVGVLRARSWARRILQEDAERADGFYPVHLEYDFGTDDAPVELGSFKLRGRIDRVDVDQQGRAVVVDYKRSLGAEYGAQKSIAEGRIQIPLYMLVVRQTLGLEVLAGLYRGLAATGERGLVAQGALSERHFTRGDELDPEGLESLLEAAVETAEEAVEGMRAGLATPLPRNAKVCATCSARANCGGAR